MVEKQPVVQKNETLADCSQTWSCPSPEPTTHPPHHLSREKVEAPPVPLTSANLDNLNTSLGAQDRAEAELGFGSEESSQGSSWESTALLEIDMAESVHGVRTLLERNSIHILSTTAKTRAGKILQKSTEILDQKRKSIMKAPDAEAIVATIAYFANKGEHTLVHELWQDLVGKTRLVPVHQLPPEGRELTPEQEATETEWLERAWRDEDHVWAKFEGNVLESAIPRLVKTGNKVLDALLPGIERITKPRPDIAYGISFEAFSREHREILHQCLAKINDNQFLSFFAVEAKCGERPIEEAENQCGTTGSSMVKVKRMFTEQVNAGKINPKPPAKANPSISAASQSGEGENSSIVHFGEHQVFTAPQSSLQVPTLSTSGTLVDAAAEDTSPFPAPPTEIPPDHADLDSIAFTLALTPQLANMNVHYAEIWADGHVEYQMQRVRPYLLTRADDITTLHHDIDNILDWGCGKRKRSILQGCDQLNAAMTAAKASKEKQSGAENKKRKV